MDSPQSLSKKCKLKMDSAQSLSKKCKNYLLKISSQHIDFLNTIWNFSLWFISPGDPAMKILSILEKFNVKPRKNASCLCFQLTRNVHFKWNIWNFKFNFLSRGQLVRASILIGSSYLYSKYYHAMRVFWQLNFCHYCSNIVRKSS